MKMRLVILLTTAAFIMLADPVKADEPRDDPFLVTSACDETKAKLTAQKLFKYVDWYFDKYRKVDPIKDKVSMESLYEEGPKVEMHEATFKTFRASFIQERNGKRVLTGIPTRSKAFVLPFRIMLGQSMTQLQTVLGPPTAISSNSILYQMGGEALSDVFFQFEADRLVEVTWSYGMAD